MSVTDSILKTIDYAIDKKISNLKDMYISGVILDIPSDDDAYLVQIGKATYKVYNGSGIALKSGDAVWIHCPNGDFNQKYISATKSSNFKKYTNSGTGDYGEGGTINPNDIITDEEIDAMFN